MHVPKYYSVLCLITPTCTKKVQQEKLAALSLLGDDLFISDFSKV